jgi:hypothetical protein
MDDRLERFAHCDPRFFPYLKTTLEKLPEDVRESVLGNPGFQVVSSPGIAEECSLLLSFADPVEHVMHLNMKTLNEPEYRIVFRIAYEFAKYSALRENPEGDIVGRQIDLLNQWGFEKDVRSMQHCRAIQGSDGYMAGYDWARHQSSDYLLQHFGLYYDEWNKGGLRRMPKDSSGAVPPVASEALLDADSADEIPLDEAVMEGIMAALKEVHPD